MENTVSQSPAIYLKMLPPLELTEYRLTLAQRITIQSFILELKTCKEESGKVVSQIPLVMRATWRVTFSLMSRDYFTEILKPYKKVRRLPSC